MTRRGTFRSLTARLLVGVGLPMIALATALGLVGALSVRRTVDDVNDRILEAAARGIAESLTIEDGEVALDLPPAIFGMLENTARDNVYYSVRQGATLLTGYDALPRVPLELSDGATAFADSGYLGRDVRVVAHVRRLPGLEHPVVVEVAETLEARNTGSAGLLNGLIALEAALVSVAALLLPLAVRWGLRPLADVRRELDVRVASDLSPLSLSGVPAELRDLVRAFNAMLVRLGGSMAAMRRFTGDASHQMRTPLSILRTHVAVLRSADPGSADARQSIEDIEAGSVRLAHLIGQLLALARADNPVADEIYMECVDLRDVALAAVSDQRNAALRAGVELVIVPAPGPVLACTAAELATELLRNLIDNAVRHGGRVVWIEVLHESRVVIEDDGPGIPAADRDRVFDRFVRLRPDVGRSGSGLGLSIARSLADAVGASLRLDDASRGRGLRASVAFGAPRAAD